MGFTWNQTPPTVALTQSPTIVSVTWPGYATSSDFQYTCDLFYWTGAMDAIPTSSQYTLVKYPNDNGAGIFDLSRILNSTLNHAWAEHNTEDNVKWFTTRVNFQFLSGSTYVTGSAPETSVDYSLALDGYQVFGEAIQQQVSPFTQSLAQYTEFFPALTSGPATQSVMYDCTQNVYQSALSRGVQCYQPKHNGTNDGYIVTGVKYTYSDGNSIDVPFTTGSFGSGSNDIIKGFNNSPTTAKSIYNSVYPSAPFSGISWYEVDYRGDYNNGNSYYNNPIRYEIKSKQKYPNVLVAFKNRFGEMDYFNFDMVSRQSMNVSRSQYQPQIGSWNSNTLQYAAYESGIADYLIDTTTSISVNTDWVSEDYNQIFKQLLVSDEIYWIYDESAFSTNNTKGLKPLTIMTSNIQFKTGVVDKLIQYSFDFQLGQSYKLIL